MPVRRDSYRNVKRVHHRVQRGAHLLKQAIAEPQEQRQEPRQEPKLKSILHRRPTPTVSRAQLQQLDAHEAVRTEPTAPPAAPPPTPVSNAVVSNTSVPNEYADQLGLFNLLSLWPVSFNVKRPEIKPANVHFDITKRAEEYARNAAWFTTTDPKTELVVAL